MIALQLHQVYTSTQILRQHAKGFSGIRNEVKDKLLMVWVSTFRPYPPYRNLPSYMEEAGAGAD